MIFAFLPCVYGSKMQVLLMVKNKHDKLLTKQDEGCIFVTQSHKKEKVMKASELIKTAEQKGYAISRYKSGVYQYSTNGYEWTKVKCTWSEFVKIIKGLPAA